MPSMHSDNLRKPPVRRPRPTFIPFCCCLAAVLGSPDPRGLRAQRYHIHAYTETEGLPSSKVLGISQDRSGRMWFATRSGIAIYDGAEWVTLDRPPQAALRSAFLRWDAHNQLWALGNETPAPLFRFDGDRWHTVKLPSELPKKSRITALAVEHRTEAPCVVVGTDRSLLFWNGRRWRTRPWGEGVHALMIVNDRVYVGSRCGLATVTLTDESLQATEIPSARGRAVRGLSEPSAGGLWAVGTDWVGRVLDDELTIVFDRLESPVCSATELPCVVADRAGGVYLGYLTTVLHVHPERGARELAVRNGLVASGATCMFLDRERNLWIGTTRGLSKVISLRFESYRTEHGLLEDEVTAIIERRNGEFVLGHNRGLTLLDDEMRKIRLSDRVHGVRVLDVAEDARGHLWAAVEGVGLAEVDLDSGVRWHREFPDPQAVLVDLNHNTWIASANGLAVRRGDRFRPVAVPAPVPLNSLRRLFRGGGDAIYIATAGDGCFRFRGGVWRQWVSQDEPLANDIYALLEHPDGTLWVGASSGLYRAEGDTLVEVSAPGPRVDRPVYFLASDRRGGIWIGTDNGVMHWADAALSHYTIRDGLVGRETNRAAGLVDSEDRVWIGTDRGLSIYHPDRERRESVPPVVELLDLEVEGQRFPLARQIELDHTQNTVVLSFRAVSFIDENRIRVRSWLEGFEPSWSEARTIGRREIRYTNLPPGQFRIHLEASNAEGVWSEPLASAPILIHRPFWQEAWFVAVSLGLFVSLCVTLNHYRAQRRYARRLENEVETQLAALRRSEKRLTEVQAAEKRRLEVTLRSIADGVIATDAAGVVVLTNPAAEAITGWPAREAVGKPLTMVLPLRSRDGSSAIHLATMTHRGNALGLDAPVKVTTRQGEGRLLEINSAPMLDVDSRASGVVLAFHDVTETQRLEDELARMERLEALGVLAGGIAHDFNNLLTVILGNVYLVQTELGKDSPQHAGLESVQAAITRARDLTQQLLTFSRGGAPVRQAASISEVIRESAALVLRGTSVRSEIDLAADLWVVEIDSGQISQVLNNLLINAAHAMPDGGTVRISGHNAEHAPPPLREGRYIEIVIQDQGHGVPHESIGRMFDPFYSTKKGGSGLGLSTAYSIVKRHEGLLTVESEVGRGTTFHLFLPASGSQITSRAPKEQSVPGGHERVLIMDDEAQVREVLGTFLTRLGYHVDYASSGDDAIERYRDALWKGQRFDVLILDLTVSGGMGGREAAQQLHSIDPSVCAIALSGYSNDPVMSDHGRYGFLGCIPKPFDAAKTAQTVRSVIDASERSFGLGGGVDL